MPVTLSQVFAVSLGSDGPGRIPATMMFSNLYLSWRGRLRSTRGFSVTVNAIFLAVRTFREEERLRLHGRFSILMT